MSDPDRAAAVAEYLSEEGRDASPAAHRAALDARWPGLTPVELQRALDIMHELRDVDERAAAATDRH